MSLSSSRASCLLTPILPEQKQRLTLAKQRYQRCAELGMCILKGTSLMLVLSLIPFIMSSTRWSRCFVGFIGGSALACTKNIFLVVFQWFQSKSETYSYVRQDSFLSYSVWIWDISFWFGVLINIPLPQLVFQHPYGCLNSCWRKKKHRPLLNLEVTACGFSSFEKN